MSLFPVVFLVMLLLVAAMAIGVMFGRKPIAGTYGGLNNLGEDGVCELCGARPEGACADDAGAPTRADARKAVSDALVRDAMDPR